MSRRNENRPGYKETKVGWIPVEWGCVRLRDLATKIGSGITPRGGERVYVEKGVAFIRSQNVLDGIFSQDGLAYITHEQHTKMSSTALKKNDVLYNITGASIGRCCRVPSYLDNANVNQHVCIIRSNGSALPQYITSLLNTSIGKKNLYESQAGGGREGLNFENLGAFQLPLPPLPEQERIAEVLSAWDRAITLTDRLIDAKQRLKKGLMQQLLTGRMRFPEFGKAVRKKGELPEGWKIKRLGSFGSFLKGKGISNSEKTETGIPCITYGEIYTRHEFVIKDFYSFIDRSITQKSQRIKRNDILFAGSGETLDEIGKCVVHTKEIEAYAGGDIVIFRPKGVNSLYLSYSLNSDLLIRQKIQLGQGHSVVHIYSAGLKTLQVSLPSLDEQSHIATVLSNCDREIELLRKNDKKLEEITIEQLESNQLILCDENGYSKKKFSIFKCLLFDTSLDGQNLTYHLCEGNWYQVDNSFIERLKNYLNPHYEEFATFIAYNHKSEPVYNAAVAENDGRFICLDGKNISPSGQKQVEPCDLYIAKENKAVLVHVKRSTRSSRLSHLFNQGVNSVELIKLEEQSKEKFHNLIKSNLKGNNEETYTQAINNKIKVVYAIITHKDKVNKSDNLPLFSRISLMRSVKSLTLMDTDVSVCFIKDESQNKEGKKKERRTRKPKATADNE